MKNTTLDNRYADHVDEFCRYIKQNIHRVLQRKCRCGNEVKLIYRTVKVGTVMYKNTLWPMQKYEGHWADYDGSANVCYGTSNKARKMCYFI
jgi:hypothetical protein